jgi:hypothetical protein
MSKLKSKVKTKTNDAPVTSLNLFSQLFSKNSIELPKLDDKNKRSSSYDKTQTAFHQIQ